MKEVMKEEGGLSASFLHIVQDLSRIKDPDIALDSILGLAMDLLDTDMAIAVFTQPDHPLFIKTRNLETQSIQAHGIALIQHLEQSCDEPYCLCTYDSFLSPGVREELGEMVSHVICLPIKAHTQLLGGLFFFLQNDDIAEDAINWVGVLAAQIGMVIENAQLFSATLRQATELGSVYETTSAIVTLSESQQVLGLVIANARKLTRCEGGGIFLVAGQDQRLLLEACVGDEDVLRRLIQNYEETFPPEQRGEGNQARTIRDERESLCASVLPMVWQQELLGYMLLYDHAEQVVCADTSIGMAHLIALQAASAIGISRLIASEREERQIAEALEQASLAVNQANNLEELLDRVLEQLMSAFSCDCANFQTLEGDTARILRHRGYEKFGLTDADMLDIHLNVHEYENLRRMIAGELVVVSDIPQSETWVRENKMEWLKSWAGVPILYERNIIGFLCLDSATPGALTEDVADRLNAFAAHAATAMHKAELYSRLSDEHGRLEVLYEITRSVSESLDQGEIQDYLIEGAMRATQAFTGVVYERDGSGEGVILSPRSLFSRKSGRHLHIPALKAFAESIFRNGRPRMQAFKHDGDVLSVIGFPLETGLRSYGAALLHVHKDFPFGEAWEDVFAAAGQQAGMALENAYRHAQVQRRLAEMTILQRLISAIAGRLDTQDVLDEVTSQLYLELGYPSVQIFQREGETLHLKSFSGPAPIVNHLSIHRGIIGRVVRTGNPVLISDVREDEDYVSLLVGTRYVMAVPYRRDDEIIGVIAVASSAEAQLENDDLDLLMVLSDYVSVALQNAKLYEQVRDSVTHLEDQVRSRTGELEEALEKAKEADRIKANFVSDISHELRTPLTNIGLYLDLLEISGEEKSHDYMLTLRRETERLGSLIEQLLAISQLDSGQHTLALEDVDLNSLVEMLVNDRARMIFKKGLVLETHVSREPIVVRLDQRLIMQAMTNLLTNAMNYTPLGGTLTISTSVRRTNGADWATVSMRDNGPGIPEEEHEKIFDRFFRGLAGRSSGIAGTGLGLSICKEIMERHHGNITVSSLQGHGAEFTIWLPLFPVDALMAD